MFGLPKSTDMHKMLPEKLMYDHFALRYGSDVQLAIYRMPAPENRLEAKPTRNSTLTD